MKLRPLRKKIDSLPDSGDGKRLLDKSGAGFPWRETGTLKHPWPREIQR